MKQYVIDELRIEDYEKLKSYFDKNYGPSVLNDIYWIQIEDNMLSDIQINHEKCHPYYIAVDLKPTSLSCELLIRSKNIIRCNCIAYANEKQLNFIIKIIDSIFKQLEIIV